MRETAIRHLTERFEAYADLAEVLSDELLTKNLDAPKNKTLKEHLWCVVGARESYTKALEAGEWAGFSCSMHRVDKAEVLDALKMSADTFEKTIATMDSWTDQQDELLTSLLEHEVMHEGQIIRHMYGLGHTLPSSWKWA